MENDKKIRLGSVNGLLITVAIGFICYFLAPVLAGSGTTFSYNNLIDGIENDVMKQILWFFANFTEAPFFASTVSGIMVIIGGFVAYILSMKNSKYKGFDICYGSSSLWPWVLASQIIALFLTIFVFRYMNWFTVDGTTWIPTFIAVVGAPPSVVLIYGASMSTLLTGSVLGGLICAPIAYWLGSTLIPLFGLPGVVANVVAMAISGIMICFAMTVLPFIKKVPVKDHTNGTAVKEDVYSTSWSVRRALAEFTEPLFYGNEVASLFLFAGLAIDIMLSGALPAYGSNAIGAILLSQFVGAGVGIFLYAHKFESDGWYATYVPVVSVGPACVLMFGATIPVAAFAGTLGAILGAPLAAYFAAKMPAGVHPTNPNVLAMALCTSIVAVVMKGIGF